MCNRNLLQHSQEALETWIYMCAVSKERKICIFLTGVWCGRSLRQTYWTGLCVCVCVRPLKAKSSRWRLFFFLFWLILWHEFSPPPPPSHCPSDSTCECVCELWLLSLCYTVFGDWRDWMVSLYAKWLNCHSALSPPRGAVFLKTSPPLPAFDFNTSAFFLLNLSLTLLVCGGGFTPRL